MSSVQVKQRRMSVPWIKSKLKTSSTNTTTTNSTTTTHPRSISPEKQPLTATLYQTQSLNSNTQSTHSQLPQTSPFLTLPIELQQKIYDYILTPWTLAIFPSQTSPEILSSDSTFNLHQTRTNHISGPPGLAPLLVCRSLTTSLLPRYGTNTTGILNIGHTSSTLERRKIPVLLTSRLPSLNRFYQHIHTLHLSIAIAAVKHGWNFRGVFPNLKRVECTIHEGSVGPVLRLDDSAEGFLAGRHDADLVGTRAGVAHLLSGDGKGRGVKPLTEGALLWGDSEVVVDVMLIGCVARDPYVRIGLHYRWEGPDVKVISRLAFYGYHLKYWETGMEPEETKILLLNNDESRVPARFRWILHRADGSAVPVVRRTFGRPGPEGILFRAA